MPPNDACLPASAAATQTDAASEHLIVLVDALRDDDEHYEDPTLIEPR